MFNYATSPQCTTCNKHLGAICHDDDGRPYRECDCTRKAKSETLSLQEWIDIDLSIDQGVQHIKSKLAEANIPELPFAELHDHCDANTLLPEDSSVEFANAVIAAYDNGSRGGA